MGVVGGHVLYAVRRTYTISISCLFSSHYVPIHHVHARVAMSTSRTMEQSGEE